MKWNKELSLKEKIAMLKNRKESVAARANSRKNFRDRFRWKNKSEIAEIKSDRKEKRLEWVRDAFNKDMPDDKPEKKSEPKITIIKIKKWWFSPFKSSKSEKDSDTKKTPDKKESDNIDYSKMKSEETKEPIKSDNDTLKNKFEKIMRSKINRWDKLPDDIKNMKGWMNKFVEFNKKKNVDNMNPSVTNFFDSIFKWYKKNQNKK